MSLNRFALAICCAAFCATVLPTTVFGAETERYDPRKGWGDIQLLEPLPETVGSDAKTSINISNSPQETVLNYLTPLHNWAIEVGIGIVTLWVLVSGTAIILVGGDASKRSTWIQRFMVAIAGLVGLVMWGVILRFLNSMFFI